MTAQTTTQRTAKHRLAVKERMARYERALREIAEGFPVTLESGDVWNSPLRSIHSQDIARTALGGEFGYLEGIAPAKNP